MQRQLVLEALGVAGGAELDELAVSLAELALVHDLGPVTDVVERRRSRIRSSDPR
jgi:hypothetical protein